MSMQNERWPGFRRLWGGLASLAVGLWKAAHSRETSVRETINDYRKLLRTPKAYAYYDASSTSELVRHAIDLIAENRFGTEELTAELRKAAPNDEVLQEAAAQAQRHRVRGTGYDYIEQRARDALRAAAHRTNLVPLTSEQERCLSLQRDLRNADPTQKLSQLAVRFPELEALENHARAGEFTPTSAELDSSPLIHKISTEQLVALYTRNHMSEALADAIELHEKDTGEVLPTDAHGKSLQRLLHLSGITADFDRIIGKLKGSG